MYICLLVGCCLDLWLYHGRFPTDSIWMAYRFGIKCCGKFYYFIYYLLRMYCLYCTCIHACRFAFLIGHFLTGTKSFGMMKLRLKIKPINQAANHRSQRSQRKITEYIYYITMSYIFKQSYLYSCAHKYALMYAYIYEYILCYVKKE